MSTPGKSRKADLLRILRVLTGWVVFAGFAAAGAGFAVPWAARGAFVPSLLAGTLYAAVFWIAAALIGGRFYCACFCPLGVLQDLASLFRRKYAPRKDRRALRFAVLTVAAVAAAAGLVLPLTGLDPYSNFGRFGDRLLRPGMTWLTDFMWGTLRWEAVTPLEPHTFSWAIFGWTAGVFVLFLALAVWRGRWYCDWICPAGTLLGLVSRMSRYRLKISEKCIRCRKCEKLCRTGAIDLAKGGIDFSRCVLCGECAASCPVGAIAYARRPAGEREPLPVQPGRREFVIAAGAAAVAAAAGVAGRFGRTAPDPMPVMPPGAKDWASFHARCTGCGLCAAGCPGKTLTPALFEYGLSGAGQMRLSFELGKCEFECHRCSSVCPTGALTPLAVRAKQRRRIGIVTFHRDRCIVFRNEEDCGACAEHCPTGALQMVPYKEDLTIPKVLPEICIGCGSCQYSCPAQPRKAMTVAGVAVQSETPDPAVILKKNARSDGKKADFPF